MYGWQQQQLSPIQMAAMMQMQQMQHMQHMQPHLPFGYPLPMANQSFDSDEGANDNDDEQLRTLFVANLDERVTEELLYECFMQAGPLESVRLPKDNMGRKRTFGFITYVHSCSTPYAQKLLQGLTLFHKKLVIKFQGKAQGQQHRLTMLPIGVCNGSHAARNMEPPKLHNYDNKCLRGANNPAYYERNERNPFKRDLGAKWSHTREGNCTSSKDSFISRMPTKSHNEKQRHDAGRDRRRARRAEQRSHHRR